MTYSQSQVRAQIYRLGREAGVLERESSGQNEFGNQTETHPDKDDPDRTVFALRTYPNRNTELQSRAGDMEQDRPVFIVPVSPDLPEPPQIHDHLEYNGEVYEVKAHTNYDTHVEFFGEPVRHQSN